MIELIFLMTLTMMLSMLVGVQLWYFTKLVYKTVNWNKYRVVQTTRFIIDKTEFGGYVIYERELSKNNICQTYKSCCIRK